MKVYVTARHEAASENKRDIEALCSAVREAGMTDFCFIRDIERYRHTFDDPKELWARAFDELAACEALLVDVSDQPSGGRLVEAGMAYALKKPVIVVKRHGITHKKLFDGLASSIITYTDHEDLSKQLKKYGDNRAFGLVDKWAVFILFLLAGGALAWLASQIFIPLALVAAVIYWLVARRLFAPLQAFDRVVIYIPLAVVWLAGFYLLQPVYSPLALAWLAWRIYGVETARWLVLLLPTTVGMIGFSHAAATDMPFSAMLTITMVCAAVVLGIVPDRSWGPEAQPSLDSPGRRKPRRTRC